ncbi:hypothetical protein M758_UG272300 [Ceratodon purpureus]|nr:hypothetical protein M758_UG272300 [Ceratodon purpureus]
MTIRRPLPLVRGRSSSPATTRRDGGWTRSPGRGVDLGGEAQDRRHGRNGKLMHGVRRRSLDSGCAARRHVGFGEQPGGWTWWNDLVAESPVPTRRSQPSGERNRSCVVQAGDGRGLFHGERLTTWGFARSVESGDGDSVEAGRRMLRMWERRRTWIATLSSCRMAVGRSSSSAGHPLLGMAGGHLRDCGDGGVA